MTEEIKKRVEMINRGEIPDGYKKTKVGIVPSEWKVNRLIEMVDEIQDKAGEEIYETLSISAGIGFVNQAGKFGKELSGKQYSKYNVLKKGDFSYNKGNSKRYPQGCIYQLKDRESAAVPNVFESFRIKTGSGDYFEQLFISGFLNKQLYSKINHGVRDDGLLNLTSRDFYSSSLLSPPLHEQEKIAEILTTQDKLIESQAKKVDELKKLKKAYLQKIFPQNGENVPEIRFKGFTNAWEQRELGYLADFNPKHELPEVFEYVDLESVVGTEMISHREETKETAPSRAQRVAQKGDLFYQTVRPYQKNNYLFDLPHNNYVFSTGYAQLRPHQSGYFLLCLVQSEEFVRVVLDNCTGTSYPAINSTDLANITVHFPKNEAEQEKIGTYFKNLDNLITLHQRKLDETKKEKKALMQLLLTGKVRVKI